jgi:hypothetical protein
MTTNATTRRILATILSFGLLLAAGAVQAQTLPGLWGSALYRVELTVAGTKVTGTFSSLDDPQAPPGQIVGEVQTGGQGFIADWTYPAGPDTGGFKAWLRLGGRNSLLVGYRWSDETEPTAFALHRAINGQLPVLTDADVADSQPATQPAPGLAPDSPVAGASHTQCLANLEELALGVLLYAQDHEERLPDAARWVDEITPYLKKTACLWCPAAPQLQYGYAMNAALSKASLADIAEPFDTVLLFESNLGTLNASGDPAGAARPPRHDGANHCAYVDGSSKRHVPQPGAVAGGAPVTPANPIVRTTPVTPATPVPAAGPTATVVMCQRLDEQKRPIDPGTVLAGPRGAAGAPGQPGAPGATPETVRATARFTGIPAGGVVECVWKREGKEFSRNRTTIPEGSLGYIWKWGPQAGGLPAGNYEVVIVCGGQQLARQPFRIVPGPHGPNGPAAPPPPVTAIFPQAPFNGMQVTYRVAGATLGQPTDTSGFTTTRSLRGRITGNTLTVSGTVRVGGYGANVIVWARSGAQYDKKEFYVKNEGGSGNPTSFSLSVPVAQHAADGGRFTIRMDGRYSTGGGSRSLIITGQCEPQ